jgi:hypothetical protein
MRGGCVLRDLEDTTNPIQVLVGEENDYKQVFDSASQEVVSEHFLPPSLCLTCIRRKCEKIYARGGRGAEHADRSNLLRLTYESTSSRNVLFSKNVDHDLVQGDTTKDIFNARRDL